MAPREGLELELMKMGRAGPPLEPRHRPQAGKSGDPCSQNADTDVCGPMNIEARGGYRYFLTFYR